MDHVRGDGAAAMTKGAGINAHIRARSDGHGHIGGPFAGGRDRRKNGVLACNIGPQKLASGDLVNDPVGRFIDRDVAAQGAGGQDGRRADRRVG